MQRCTDWVLRQGELVPGLIRESELPAIGPTGGAADELGFNFKGEAVDQLCWGSFDCRSREYVVEGKRMGKWKVGSLGWVPKFRTTVFALVCLPFLVSTTTTERTSETSTLSRGSSSSCSSGPWRRPPAVPASDVVAP